MEECYTFSNTKLRKASYLKTRTFLTIPVFITDLTVLGTQRAQSAEHSPANQKVPGSIHGSDNSAYEQYSQENSNCTVCSWELEFGLELHTINRSPWSSATEKGIDSLPVWLILILSLSNYLLITLGVMTLKAVAKKFPSQQLRGKS